MTRRRIKLFGPAVEINPFKRFMSEFGSAALFVSFIPELLIGALLACGGFFSLIWAWAGGKFVVCYYQLLSMEFEKQLRESASSLPSPTPEELNEKVA